MNTASQDPSSTVQPDPVRNTSKVDPDSVKVSAKNDSSLHRASRDGRCQYRFSKGKRCRLPGSKSQFGLCSHHFDLNFPGASKHQSQTDSEDLSSELLGEASGFESAADVKEFLARLLVLVTKGRVIPPRAAVLTYITNQLRHSQARSARMTTSPNKSSSISLVLTGTTRFPARRPATSRVPATLGAPPRGAFPWLGPRRREPRPGEKNVMTNNSSRRLDGHSGVR